LFKGRVLNLKPVGLAKEFLWDVRIKRGLVEEF
jgi:hypothetical protein